MTRIAGRRMGPGRATGLLLLAALAVGGASACGRYGAPVRAEQYQQQERDRARAESERQKQTPQERNEPMPSAP